MDHNLVTSAIAMITGLLKTEQISAASAADQDDQSFFRSAILSISQAPRTPKLTGVLGTVVGGFCAAPRKRLRVGCRKWQQCILDGVASRQGSAQECGAAVSRIS